MNEWMNEWIMQDERMEYGFDNTSNKILCEIQASCQNGNCAWNYYVIINSAL